ncbi:CUGBP Elav-like family member 2 isoform X1 [Rhagoletis pomonella]|uniref:CUGBP Elav-like family member 2 isoform X1 n=1 Tax=Rhagoletis pomonella TaxID=28610 RepID=UPI00177E0919|nr:CUGBP Elav-like family member 2 isoform X1 [Rhagoletis pomonella]
MKNRGRLKSASPAIQNSSPISPRTNTNSEFNIRNTCNSPIPIISSAANGTTNSSITSGNGSGNVNDGVSSISSSPVDIEKGTGNLTLTRAMQLHKSNVQNSSPNSFNTTNGHQPYPSITSTYWLPPPNTAPYLVPERKLFVGMLNKKYNEADVRQLFTGHGTIEECTVLRDQNGQSKGCAFVTFATKHNAIGAIKTLHQSRTMEGCSAPLVVKFADTQKEKDQKKIQQMQASIVGITALTSPTTGAIAGLASAHPNGFLPTTAAALVPNPISVTNARTNCSMPLSMATVAVANPASALVPSSAAISVPPSLLTTDSRQQTSPYLTTAEAMNVSPAQLHIFQQLQAFGLHPTQYLQGLNFPPDHSVPTASLSAATADNGLLSTRSISMQNLITLATLGAHNYPSTQSLQPHSHVVAQTQQQQQQDNNGMTYTPQAMQSHMTHLLQMPLAMTTQLTGVTPPTLGSAGESLTPPYVAALSPLTNGMAFTTTALPLYTTAQQTTTAGKQVEGPEGSNLFIYHLPQEFTDTDLASTFLPFGNVLSAKVFIDKQTNLSKCFGFVSYDNPHSASAAIQAMHGFHIGSKRLKVQHKRSKDAAKPY